MLRLPYLILPFVVNYMNGVVLLNGTRMISKVFHDIRNALVFGFIYLFIYGHNGQLDTLSRTAGAFC
uniref:Uncharacterized protein n=1 Tax=Rhizophora mucronata TaxID=61149 RepID=A0A2P2IU91_RHIMU